MLHSNDCLKKLFSFALAMLLLAGCVTGCTVSSNEEGVTGEESFATESEESTANVTVAVEETTGPDEPADPWDTALSLVADGGSAYRIIVPAYAAAWELDAARTMAELLAGVGATLEICVDTETDTGEHEIVIGYTNRNILLPDDFYAVGKNGYQILVRENRLFVGANTEQGMMAAMEKLVSDLLTDEIRVGIYERYVCKAVEEASPASELTPVGVYGESLIYAQQMANGVQGAYTDGRRTGFAMSNLQMSIRNELVMDGQRTVSELTNAYGVPYITNTMTAYAQMEDGTRYASSNSSSSGRVNIFRYGAYYYESHILDQNLGNSRVQDTESGAEPYDFLKETNSFKGSNTSARKDKTTQNLMVTIRDRSDPYVSFDRPYAIPTEDYDAILLTLKTETCSSGQIYLAAGSQTGVNGAQSVSFSITPGDEFHTYIVPINGVSEYVGNITAFRLDFDGIAGEIIEISEVKAIRTKDSGVPDIALDRTMHTYSDKLNHVLHFVTTDAVDAMAAYGMETVVAKSRVNSLLVIDKNGEHASLADVDWASAVAIAFDMDRAGVFGYILTLAEGVGGITVTERDGMYVIDQQVAAKDHYDAGESLYVGQRIYTDMTHSFDGFRQAVREERSPLSISVTSAAFSAQAIGYEPLRGAYRFDLEGTGFNEAYYGDQNLHYRVDAQINGDETDRKIYVYTHTTTGALECAAVLGEDDQMLPMTLQVCKNFRGENEEPVFDPGDMSYGEVYFPMVVSKEETLSFSVLNLYQNWGKYPLKQISSIQFVAPYYHLSTGVTETNCIAPYYVNGKDRWTLPDFRSMSAPLWENQPQHTSAGRLYFLEYTDAEGNYVASESTVDHIDSNGPVYSDIWMSYISDDGKISVDYRHMEMPQTDENRTYYEIRMTVLEDITFDNFKREFNIFSMDGRFVRYEQFSYLDEQNQSVTVNPSEKARDTYYLLGNESPYMAYSYVSGNNDYINMALIVKDWDITVGGAPYTGALVAAEKQKDSLNYVHLTLDLKEVTLKAGDEINLTMILLPWGSQETAKGDISSVLQVRKDSCLDPMTVTVAEGKGEVIADAFMPKVLAKDGMAEFTLKGGENNMAVRVYGLESYERPVIEELVNGAWVAYDTASEANGYDGYAVYYEEDGTFSCAFIVPMTEGVERTFRVSENQS